MSAVEEYRKETNWEEHSPSADAAIAELEAEVARLNERATWRALSKCGHEHLTGCLCSTCKRKIGGRP